MDNNVNESVVLSIEDVSENEKYVVVKIKEVVGNRIEVKLEKGIKDENGDINEFVPMN